MLFRSPFVVVDISHTASGQPIYVLKGLLYRIQADSLEDDLIKQDSSDTRSKMMRDLSSAKRHAMGQGPLFRMPLSFWLRGVPGKVLHIDGDPSFMETCLRNYEEVRIKAVGRAVNESEQPQTVRRLLEEHRPDILILTGHDGVKKFSNDLHSLESYRTSKYFVQSVREARRSEERRGG